MQRGIIGLFFKNSEFSVVPKALNAWKDYVLKRSNDNFKQFIESNKVQQWMVNNSINSITDKAALVEVY